ncbi:hypothetical protein FNV43_RR10143 [Rhamnella rubrinervis]|uniref:Uncharacterized protein n=1 Tax=Rhamnella rubrinervis TaxID=2594499 RepID=A0A8K0HCK8_9ROSA|nr:hypothetical protein FNV43_RR10143 [Rhamnella rubrinervis]
MLALYLTACVGRPSHADGVRSATQVSAAGGIFGLIAGLLVESLLFIIRASNEDLKSTTPTSNPKKDHMVLGSYAHFNKNDMSSRALVAAI